jgi:hypothetical protein
MRERRMREWGQMVERGTGWVPRRARVASVGAAPTGRHMEVAKEDGSKNGLKLRVQR